MRSSVLEGEQNSSWTRTNTAIVVKYGKAKLHIKADIKFETESYMKLSPV